MQFFRKIKAKICGWEDQPSKKEVEQLVNSYQSISSSSKASDFFKPDDIKKLIRISRYADSGEYRALEFAFCLGFSIGEEGAIDRIIEHFEKK